MLCLLEPLPRHVQFVAHSLRLFQLRDRPLFLRRQFIPRNSRRNPGRNGFVCDRFLEESGERFVAGIQSRGFLPVLILGVVEFPLLDVFNGLLLAPNLDAAFDAGFITVGDAGEILVSDLVRKEARGLLGIDQVMKLRGIADEHRQYLFWHRNKVFR